MAGRGLRELKKEQTRGAIASAAIALFAERGFEAVTVAQVAEVANVAPQTVFNYFPSKEDLVLGTYDEGFAHELAEAVRSCRPGESVTAAVAPMLFEHFDHALASEDFEAVVATARLVDASPSLQARQRADAARFAGSLAEAVADTVSAAHTDVEPLVVAYAATSVYQAIFETARRRVLASQRGQSLRDALRNDVERGWALIQAGFGAYKRPPRAGQTNLP